MNRGFGEEPFGEWYFGDPLLPVPPIHAAGKAINTVVGVGEIILIKGESAVIPAINVDGEILQ